ncbi:hypothetical protein PVAG01_00363 [Phlyctema vagabunda]|uniref:Methyltransferase domain-containing protein n=1 Tax=Phlyctema vagabunda TaxID=108571 RepID=A0ABR4PU13_9HELO
MYTDDDTPIFAFQDLDYIPYGFSSTTAPYIETPAATMRAAATLMHLGLSTVAEAASGPEGVERIVVCDLGCGDGDFLLSLLDHIKPIASSITTLHGVGVDYNVELINSAGLKSKSQGLDVQWLIYDFNDDQDDLVHQLTAVHNITHIFIYLVPKQLALQTVRNILTGLCQSGVVVCCYKFFPKYLTPARRDTLMELVLFDETS